MGGAGSQEAHQRAGGPSLNFTKYLMAEKAVEELKGCKGAASVGWDQFYISGFL